MAERHRNTRKNRSGEATRASLLSAARDEFLAAGYVGTSLRRITREAGVHQYSVKYHFGTKEDLFRALVSDYLGRFYSLIQSPSGSPEERVSQFADRYFAFIKANPETPALVQRLLVERDPKAVAIISEAIGPIFKLLRMIVPQRVDDDAMFSGVLAVMGFVVAPYAYAPLLAELGIGGEGFERAHEDQVRNVVAQLISRYNESE